ncbi:uncharacterized protein CEXT_4821 [Caerostris extrusa]|uniref:Reverse transcriptase domain-containing protein n=1 Tax=Caerostris extrusa TaxID=172846 RepID=A0AAV4N1W0_CAEEX|nr:uncharacterized protein CEXT_4821 [Caerostris extrusa]
MISKKFTIDKPTLRKPQIICFDVAQDTCGDKILEDLHSQFTEVGHENDDFHIKHHFNSKRGVNWIVEVNPSLFSKVMVAKKIALGWEKSNWFSVKSTIFNIIRARSSSGFSDVNCLISTIQKEIAARLCTTSKNKRTPKRANGSVWWTQELRAKRSKTRALRRLYQKEKEPTLRTTKLAAFKRCQTEYKKMIINTKTNKFKSFINSVTTSSFFGKNFKILTHKKNRQSSLNCILRDDDSTTSSLQDTYSEILSFHFPCSASVDSISSFFSSSQDLVPLTTMELEAVIEGIKPKKASGIDGLPGEILKEVFYANPDWFTSLLNFLLSTGHFPHIWKWARIVLIPKEGRALNHQQDFRPICILPCWGKVLDNVITERLAYHLESGKLLLDLQYGFRKQRSTINALQHIKDFIHSARNRFKITWRVFDNDVRGFAIYPDGSKLNGHTGCALVVFIDGHEDEHLLCSSIQKLRSSLQK